MSDRPTPADRLRGKKPRRITVGVYLDEAPADRLDAAVRARHDARRERVDADVLAELDRTVDQAQAALDDVTLWFTFQALGRTACARLLAEHPPTPEAVAEAAAAGRPVPEYHAADFAPALIHASLVAPALTRADVDALYLDDSGWNEAELGGLFAAALAVNMRARPLAVREP